MPENILKSIKWSLIVMMVVAGFAALVFADKYNSVKPVMVAVLSFGLAYILAFAWREMRDKVLMYSVACVVGTALAARYLPPYIYIYTGFEKFLDWNFFIVWAVFVVIVGAPIMFFVFREHGD